MDIALVLLAASALIGATAGLRLKAFALAPIALLIALVSTAVLRLHGFGPGSGIVIIIAGPRIDSTAPCSGRSRQRATFARFPVPAIFEFFNTIDPKQSFDRLRNASG
jgi:hypothetical protein